MGCNNLALNYEAKKGLAYDLDKINELFEKACIYGVFGEPCNSIGVNYQDGKGVEKNIKQANTYYGKACFLNSGWGCFNAVRIY